MKRKRIATGDDVKAAANEEPQDAGAEGSDDDDQDEPETVSDEDAAAVIAASDAATAEPSPSLAGAAPAPAPAAPPRKPPTIGRIVTYTSAGEKSEQGEEHPAVITGVDADTVALRVFTRTSDFIVPRVQEGTAPGSWRWPPRV